jgi:hypothetical protein
MPGLGNPMGDIPGGSPCGMPCVGGGGGPIEAEFVEVDIVEAVVAMTEGEDEVGEAGDEAVEQFEAAIEAANCC